MTLENMDTPRIIIGIIFILGSYYAIIFQNEIYFSSLITLIPISLVHLTGWFFLLFSNEFVESKKGNGIFAKEDLGVKK